MKRPQPLTFGSTSTWYEPNWRGRIPRRDIYGYPIPAEIRRLGRIKNDN